ncbi:hypothetical protein DH2020_042031 [Rehmannia glutinosa]|uniref:Protein SCAR n=1 Tax=Rehmannia glutinosa TaxID=99300 RepID=A0ABR0UPZ1_REHGL
MPLVRVEVRNEYGLGAPEMYREANKEEPKEILEGVAVAGLVGVLRQLGDLADFAAGVFHGLQEEVMITSSRSHKLVSRVKRIEAALSPLEKAVLAQRSHLHFAYTAGSNWHAPIRCEQNHFLYSDLPQCILDSYEDSRDPPRLHLLDRFDPGGPGSCLKRYSDPCFFKRASEASGEASTEKVLKDQKGHNIKLLICYPTNPVLKLEQKRRSWRKNGEVSRGASFSYQSGRMQFTQFKGGDYTSPSQPMSTYDATPRSDFSEQSNLDLRNSKDDFSPSYSVQPKEQESRGFISSPVKRHDSDYLDYNFLGEKVADACEDIQINITQEQGGCSSYYVTRDDKTAIPEPTMQEDDMESFSGKLDLETQGDNAVTFETVEKMNVQTCDDQALPTFESGDIHLDDFESEADHFMDALNTIEPVSEPDIDCTRNQDIDKSEDKAAEDKLPELMIHNLECQTSNSESNVSANSSLINSGFEHNPRDDIDDRRSNPESQKYSPETCNVNSATFWTNGGLLGLQPSKPPDCSVLNDLPQDRSSKKDGKIVSSSHNLEKDPTKPDRTEGYKNSKDGLDTDSSTCQEYQESGISFRKPFWKISPADLDVKLGKQGDLLIPNKNANAYEQKNHQNFAYRTFSGRTNLSGRESLVLSPSSSPPLAHMKISFQPIDGFVTSKLKLNFLDGNTTDQTGIENIFPSFQLVPEASFTRNNVGSDSDDDTFYRSSPSLSDDCQSHQSESNSEQWEKNGESPSSKEPVLYDSLRRISLTESASTVSVNGTTGHGDIHENSRLPFPFLEYSMQHSQSRHSFDRHSLDTLNHSFREELRNDTNSNDLEEPKFATTSEPPPLPPVQWRGTKPHLDDTEDKCDVISKGSNYAFDLNHSASTISQQPKPAPLADDQILETTNEQKSKKFGSLNSNGRRKANHGKNIDEKEDFLHQIRTKSFNLRPTVPAKPTVPLGGPSNVQVNAILEKANAIRQAVGSEDGDWSDT